MSKPVFAANIGVLADEIGCSRESLEITMVDASERIIILSALLLTVIIVTAPIIQEIYEIKMEETTSNIIFRYGVSGAMHSNELDTFKGIFTQDMVNKDPVTTKLDLTQDELEAIYQKMVDIDFFPYPKIYYPKEEGSVIGSTEPFLTYYLEYLNETGSKVVLWDTQFVAPEDIQYKNLRDLAQLIIEIIKAKPEY